MSAKEEDASPSFGDNDTSTEEEDAPAERRVCRLGLLLAGPVRRVAVRLEHAQHEVA